MLVKAQPQQKITLAPFVRELPADLETPVSAYLKLAGKGPSFLLESVSGGEHLARYSFIGLNPSRAYVIRNNSLESHSLSRDGEILATRLLPAQSDPLVSLRLEMAGYRHRAATPGLPRFNGGLVGYMSYDMLRFFEPSIPLAPHPDLPEAIFLLSDILVAFDHAYGKIVLIANLPLGEDEAQARSEAEERLDELQDRLAAPLPVHPSLASKPAYSQMRSNMTSGQFKAAVRKAKEYIAAGDIFQVVLSQRLSRYTSAQPFDIYRALRRLNPSPYLFYFDFGHLAGEPGFHLVGASPEMHVRLEGRTATLRPIAGTRPRGDSPAEDRAYEKDLLADPKEIAEHVMLLDLARNDLGRVCKYGSLRIPEQIAIERYSHVMHIVSQVEGELNKQYDAFDLMRATFPAGTVSGAPKVRAAQIIAELENEPRGPYAGAVGYFSYDGSLDTCITIRTLVMRGQTISIQAGAGIVADSEPGREYQETLNKARALTLAVEMAEEGC